MFKNCDIELVQIVDYVTGSLGKAERQTLQRHVDAECPDCTKRLVQIEALNVSDEKPEPEILAVNQLLDIQELHYAGVRSAASLARRRVYESESRVCIDIQQQESEDGLLVLEGQVLIRGGGLDEVAGAEVVLSQSGQTVRECETDVVGDFTFVDLSSGIYDLAITTSTLAVNIQDIDL
jgi:hypothetical protein